MSKNIFFSIFLAVLFTVLLSACNKEDEEIGILVSGVTLELPTSTLVDGALIINESIILTVTIQPNNAFNQSVIWRSSNEIVATVDNNGRVTAKSPGSATITVTTMDGGFTASLDITVKIPVVPVTGISLNKNILPLFVDDTETLIASVAPDNATNQTVIWTSSNETVATVTNNGKVTAKMPGTATITVTTEDGGKTASCDITVAIVQVTGVTLNRSTLTMNESTSSILIATILPENATDKSVTWTSSNKKVATINSQGVVKGESSGTATITVATQDGNKTATCIVTVQPCGCGLGW